MDILKTSGFLRLNQIIGDKKRGIHPIIPVSRATFWQWCKDGRAPKPIKLGEKTTVWTCSSIAELVEKLKASGAPESGTKKD